MPKKDIDYSKTIIYKITCNDETVNYTYVGHTTDFTKRKYHHKNTCKNENSISYNIKLYKTIREHGGWENWNMIEVACYNCKDSTEARIKEQEHYEILKANLNSILPYVKSKKYNCEICNIFCNNEKIFQNHIQSNKHRNKINNKENEIIDIPSEIIKIPKNKKIFICEKCDFTCYKESNYKNHLETKKHKLKMSENIFYNKLSNFICENCNKNYNTLSGLWKHKKKCIIKQNKLISNKDEEINELKNMMKDLMKHNGELMKQNSELIQTIKEITIK